MKVHSSATSSLLFLVIAFLSPPVWGSDQEAALTARMTIDFGEDVGQAFGTLWEAKGLDGKPIAGAGFLNAYNTQDRSDRRMLHVYLRTSGNGQFAPQQLPRPTSDAGTYLFGFDGRLFAKGRTAAISRRVADSEAGNPEAACLPKTTHENTAKKVIGQ
jgi:hypothetical protein